mmetsp:Transcript_3292/g.5133  ORF Transcript_3292/g.5133 Transcript_3292/m.5133 type:complete len:107 (+) Transcript_3292:66-386(+)
MKCHYEVLDLSIYAPINEIHTKYRYFYQIYHSDKRKKSIDMNEIAAAYTILSDPFEKKWYDDHREMILRAGDASSDDDSPVLNLWKYFNTSCYNELIKGDSPPCCY